MGVLLVRLIEPGDDVTSFRSGHPALDAYLVQRARKNQNMFGNTYVAVDGNQAVGYVTVMSKHVARESIGGNGPEEWPTLLIGRLAVDEGCKSKGAGKALLHRAFEIAIGQHYAGGGCVAVVVDAKLDTKPPADGYYAKFGFKPFKDQPIDSPGNFRPMYLKIKNVQTLAAKWKEARELEAAQSVEAVEAAQSVEPSAVIEAPPTSEAPAVG